jgi:phospholipase/carboxylesterase
VPQWFVAEFIHLYEPGDPTLVLLHGTGGDENDMLALGRALRPDAGHLALRGKEPEHGMNRWFRRLSEGVFDLPNLYERADELANYLEEKLPEGHRIAVGFSNGANIAAAILLRRPETFSAALLLAPMVPFVPEALPDLTGIRVHMDCGERDPMVPKENAAHLAGMLSKAGARVSVRWHPGGHGLDQEGIEAAKDFLKWL